MKKPNKSFFKKAGLPPGTLSPPDYSSAGPAKLTLYGYNESVCSDKGIQENIDLDVLLDADSVSWLNVDGSHDSAVLTKLGRTFGIHPLVLEDVQNSEHRPKIEDYGDYIFIIFKMLRWDSENGEVIPEQVSLIVGSTFVISFQEREGDVFDTIRQRIISGTGRIRRENASYLAYAILDSIVDNYFLVLEELENLFEELEEKIILSRSMDAVKKVHHLKKQLIKVRRSLWPLQELLYNIQKEEISLLGENVLPFFRDVHDHALRLMDTVEILRDMSAGLVELHASTVSNDMNSVMKVLTIIATIFIPLTFIAGIYGMNFTFMPELGLRWAYPVVLGIMGGVGIGMVIYFKRKHWL